MIVCIAEKPSVARDIARILGANKREDGFLEGNGYCVTWVFGHLCTLKDPEEYSPEWKRWSLATLPMLPPRFGIKVIKDKGVKKQFNVIKKLLSQADEVINCGDAGQEGELIQRWVMSLAGNKSTVKRLWISSLTDDAIREGLANLRPESEFNNLYHAGLSRAIGDWLLGLNATRLYSLKYSNGSGVLSVGRVQTPTLALVVQRQKEIESFVVEKYWELSTIYRDVTFRASKLRFNDKSDAQQLADTLSSLPIKINSIEKKKGKESPPRLFDLTSLQVECNKLWGWSADKTLKLIQILYEKKVTTYPRVDTTYLTDDLYPRIPDILRRMTPYANLSQPLLSAKIIKPKRIFDNSKVTDHHAIIPTGTSPTILEGDEKLLYHLIALRFIAAFYPDCEYLNTTVDANVGEVKFKASGKMIVTPGWRIVIRKDSTNDTDEDGGGQVLPDFNVGESGPHKPKIVEKTTQPPKLYTEGTLLRAMETAGRSIEDEELREALKVNGIGRPSTRAATIETLFKRKYIERKRKSIQATDAGIKLIETIKNELLKSAKLTGLWENKLRRIESGNYSAGDFIDEIKKMVVQVVAEVVADKTSITIETGTSKKAKAELKEKKNSVSGDKESALTKRRPPIKAYSEIVCPICGKGHILKGRTAFGCSRYKEGCGFIMPFAEIAADTKPGALRTKIERKYGKK